MTKPLRHTRHEIETAGKIAADLNISVRMEADGAITFIPANHNERISNNVARQPSMGQVPKEWN